MDTSKRSPASLFYLPCQAKVPTDSFFHDFYNDETRTMLDPKKWIENSVIPFPKHQVVRDAKLLLPATIDQAKVDQATAEWRQSINHRGEGDARFWTYALALRWAGMGFEQIEQTLQVEAINGRSPDERQAQIPSIMKTLTQRKKVA